MYTHWDREYLTRRFDRIEGMLRLILAAMGIEQETTMASIQDLIDTVAQQSTVIESVEALLDGLVAQLAAAGADPAKLDELKAAIEANTAKLAGAVARHTGSEEELHAEGM